MVNNSFVCLDVPLRLAVEASLKLEDWETTSSPPSPQEPQDDSLSQEFNESLSQRLGQGSSQGSSHGSQCSQGSNANENPGIPIETPKTPTLRSPIKKKPQKKRKGRPKAAENKRPPSTRRSRKRKFKRYFFIACTKSVIFTVRRSFSFTFSGLTTYNHCR